MRLAVVTMLVGGALWGTQAIAEPVVTARLPVIAAHADHGRLSIRLPRGLGSRGAAGVTRTVSVEAFDAAGVRIGQTTQVVSGRLTYATIAMPGDLLAASRLVVTAR